MLESAAKGQRGWKEAGIRDADDSPSTGWEEGGEGREGAQNAAPSLLVDEVSNIRCSWSGLRPALRRRLLHTELFRGTLKGEKPGYSHLRSRKSVSSSATFVGGSTRRGGGAFVFGCSFFVCM